MSLRLPIAVALVVTAFALFAWSSGALAGDRIEVSSRVTLAPNDPFHGKVLSRKAACERDRVVAVYRVDPGPDGLYDKSRSNASGEWSIPAGMPNGRFYTIARQRSISNGGTTLVCGRAVSSKVEF